MSPCEFVRGFEKVVNRVNYDGYMQEMAGFRFYLRIVLVSALGMILARRLMILDE